MISLITKHVLFMQWILTDLVTFSSSIKTYQVERINESSYLVTSLPQFDHRRFKNMRNFKRIIPIDNNKRYVTVNSYYGSTPCTVNVGGRKGTKARIPASMINRARDHYFRHYYATLKTTVPELPIRNSFEDSTPPRSHQIPSKLKHNLNRSRCLALRLIVGVTRNDLERENKVESVKRNKRRVKMRKRSKIY